MANYFCRMFKRNARTNIKIIELSKLLLSIFFIVGIDKIYRVLCNTKYPFILNTPHHIKHPLMLNIPHHIKQK